MLLVFTAESRTCFVLHFLADIMYYLPLSASIFCTNQLFFMGRVNGFDDQLSLKEKEQLERQLAGIYTRDWESESSVAG